MKHSNFALRGRFRLLVRGKQGDPRISFSDKGWHAVPHAVVKPLEPENVDVPFGGALDVAHAHRYMVDTFEFHRILDRMYRIYRTRRSIPFANTNEPNAKTATRTSVPNLVTNINGAGKCRT